MATEEFSEINQGVPDGLLSSFTVLWKTVNEMCTQAFSIFENCPTKDLSVAYRELNANICKSHALVYKLTAYPYQDCPALLRGSNSSRVVGDNQESTQVLVVYYLFREFLKNQVQHSKHFADGKTDIICAYLDSYENYSAGVNLTKCVFTYLQWVWQKLGLPDEHTILPAEVIALHLWAEQVLSEDTKSILKVSAMSVIQNVRYGQPVDFSTIENVKRLSLNLSMLNDSRQTLYTTILEEPYMNSINDFFGAKKDAYKSFGPEQYILICVRALEKEKFLAKCFLCKQSFEKVRNHLIQILIHEEAEYFRTPVKECLACGVERNRINKIQLANLYELLGGGLKVCWIEDVIRQNVAEKAMELTREHMQNKSNLTPPMIALEAIKEAFLWQRKIIIEIFGFKPRLLDAMLYGLKNALDKFVDSYVPGRSSIETQLASGLAVFAAEELDFDADAVEKGSGWITEIYSILEKKDDFHLKYVKLLESRLLKYTFLIQSQTKLEDALQKEELFLNDLFSKGKNFDFVYCCQIMLKDVYVRSLEYQHLCSEVAKLRPLVLNKFIWSGLTPPLKRDIDLLPFEVLQMVENFCFKYKKNLAPGRRLTFLPHYSTALVHMRTSQNTTEKGVRLVLSSRQLPLVFLFNTKETWGISELEESISATESELNEILSPFFKMNIFTQSPTRDAISVARSFTIAKSKLILIPDANHELVQQGGKLKNTRTSESMEKERTFAIEGCIVRLLKQEGFLHIDKIEEFVCKNLEKFSINRRDIKKVLEKLIDREYVFRDKTPNVFIFAP